MWHRADHRSPVPNVVLVASVAATKLDEQQHTSSSRQQAVLLVCASFPELAQDSPRIAEPAGEAPTATWKGYVSVEHPYRKRCDASLADGSIGSTDMQLKRGKKKKKKRAGRAQHCQACCD